MHKPHHLAAALLIAAATLHAQIHSPQVNIKRKAHPDNLEWLWQYATASTTGTDKQVVLDPRFKPLLTRYLVAPQAFWGDQQTNRTTLADTAITFLTVPGQAVADRNRYLTITGCVPHFCPDRGLFWADLRPTRSPDPVLIFAAIDWTTENRTPDDAASTYTLWLFPSQPLSPDREDPNRIPPAFLASLTRWTAQPSSGSNHLQHITTAVLVDPDGTPHELPPTILGITPPPSEDQAHP